jgi:Ca-activated chloride channel family protein
MNFNQFNFSDPELLWLLLSIPLLSIVGFFASRRGAKATSRLEKFADRQLLPYLLVHENQGESKWGHKIGLWSASIALGVCGLAGPRWDFHDVHTFRPNKSLVLLLNLSNSMDATDIKPSRLALARQKIEDILKSSPGVSVGLVAFAADAHMVTPVTEDKSAILHLLSSIKTDLVSVQGSQLAPALKMAKDMLNEQPGNQKSVLLLSDGGFDDTSAAISYAKTLAHDSIVLNAIGFGTVEGAPTPAKPSGLLRDESGQIMMSRLNEDVLSEISRAGGGNNFPPVNSALAASLAPPQVRKLFSSSFGSANSRAAQTIRDWEPRFYFLLLPALLLLLPMFRSTGNSRKAVAARSVFIAFALIALGNAQAHAETSLNAQTEPPNNVATHASQAKENIFEDSSRLFKNKNIQAREAFHNKNYSKAEADFSDPYRKGVAQFRAGKFVDAEKSFRASTRPQVATDAKYDLGNTLAAQGKYPEAIQQYKDLLKSNPQHKDAAANLKILQDLLKNPPPTPPQQKQADQKNDQKNEKNSQQGDQNNKQQSQAGKDNKDNKGSEGSAGKKGEKPGEGQQKQANKSDSGKNKHEKVGSPHDGSGDPKKSDQNLNGEKQSKISEQSKDLGKDKRGLPASDFDEPALVEHQRARTAKDIDADQWLNQIGNDPHTFLKNQFGIESARAKAQPGGQQ